MEMDNRQHLRALAHGLRGRASAPSEAEAGASFDPRVADTLDLIECGEPKVAFENLVQNVYEFDVTLSQAEYQAFGEAGQALNLSPDTWVFLAELVR